MYASSTLCKLIKLDCQRPSFKLGAMEVIDGALGSTSALKADCTIALHEKPIT